MLPQKNRLSLRTEFKRIKADGRLIPDRFFGLLLVKGESSQPPRLAFIVSKKVAPQAVKRNQLRRLLAEAVRPLLPKLKAGTEAVFLAKKSLLEQNLNSVQAEVKRVFQLSGCLKNEANNS